MADGKYEPAGEGLPDGWLKERRPRKNRYGSRIKGDMVNCCSPDSIVKMSQIDKFLLALFFFFSRTRRRTACRCINRKKERSKLQCRIHGLG